MTPPNILWILTTQWRARTCGYAGDADARTPAIDALAAEAVDFTQAVTPHPFGPFARAALRTGRPSPENGVRDYFDPLPADTRTIAHELADGGFRTAFFGKWHLAEKPRDVPLVGDAHARLRVAENARGGFAFWEGFEGGFQLNDPWLHGTTIAEPRRFPGYQSDVVCERAAEWLAGAKGSPWFCVVSLEPPHPPYDASAAGVKPRDPASLDLPSNVPAAAEEKARRELAGYHAHLEATDRAIGRLLENTDPSRCAVVFTSVHGDMHGAHGLFRKGWPHEESVRVPLLVRAPGVAARKDRAAVSLLDLPEITRELAAVRFHEIRRDHARISMPSVVVLPHQCDRVWRGVRTSARKLVLGPDGAPWLFFDLERDPGERANLAEDPRSFGEIGRLRELC
ncbi:MAG: sulfatase-like hydrolase/transferase [Opitutaceae bacterium]